MATRLSRYAASYSANVRAVERFAEIKKTIETEQDRQAAIQSYLVAERANLTNLEQVFAARPTQDGLATEILKATNQGQANLFRAEAAAKAATGAKGQVPKGVLDIINKENVKGTVGAVAAGNAADLAATLLAKTGKDALSGADAAATLDYLSRLPSMPAAKLANARNQAAKVTDRPAAKASTKPLTAEEQAQIQGQKAATEAIYFGSPQGYAGGFDGEAIADARSKIEAPKGSKFTTGDEAYRAYLSMLDDGYASVEELASITGQEDPKLAAEEFEFARRLYTEAKINKAYTNADRKYFEPAWLEQAKRVTDLQNEYNATKQAYGGRTPAQEAAYRELKARGIDPDDPHARYAGTPVHGYLHNADRIYSQTLGAGEELVPSTTAQKLAANLVNQYATAGTEWKVKDIEKQLGKILSGKDLEAAVSFALAYDRVKTEGATPESQLALQTEEAKRKAAAAREHEAKLKQIEEEMTTAQAAQRELELKASRISQAADIVQREYKRQRALGKTADEAMQIARTFLPAPPTAEEAAAARTEQLDRNIKHSAAAGAIQSLPMKPTADVLAEPLPSEQPAPQAPVAAAPAPAEAPVTSPRRRPRPAVPAATPAPTPTPAPVAPPAPAVKESEQLMNMIRSGTIKPNTPQYAAAIARISALRKEGK